MSAPAIDPSDDRIDIFRFQRREVARLLLLNRRFSLRLVLVTGRMTTSFGRARLSAHPGRWTAAAPPLSTRHALKCHDGVIDLGALLLQLRNHLDEIHLVAA